MKSTTETAASRYRAAAQEKEAEIVDVKVPSGFVFKFAKPSRFAMLFGLGNLPMSAASRAVESWQKDGIGEIGGKNGEPSTEDALELFESAVRIRDQVIRLSVEPKLVMGVADESKGELSTDDVANEDLEYLFHWVSTGGNPSAALGTFPAGSQSSAVAQPNRQARRAAAKQAGGNHG